MRTTMLLCALTIGTSMAAASGAPSRAEFERAKYGRYTTAAARPIQMEQPAIPDCCRSLQAHELNAGVSEERNRVKYGRYSPAKEARVKIAAAKLVIHGQKCLVLDRCPLPADATSTVAAVSGDRARMLAKFGRVFGVKATPAAVTGPVHLEPCEHACCQAGA